MTVDAIRLVVGLGNPGARYRADRHNIGFRIVEAIAAEAGIALSTGRFDSRFGSGTWRGLRVGLLLPETFMNRSGSAVVAALHGLAVADPDRDLIVVFDDADLPFGRLRLRARGSDGGHRGLRDVLAATGASVPRLRFGIGRPDAGQDTRAFVLEAFSHEEERALATYIPRACDAVASAFSDGFGLAMSVYNAAPAERTADGSGE